MESSPRPSSRPNSALALLAATAMFAGGCTRFKPIEEVPAALSAVQEQLDQFDQKCYDLAAIAMEMDHTKSEGPLISKEEKRQALRRYYQGLETERDRLARELSEEAHSIRIRLKENGFGVSIFSNLSCNPYVQWLHGLDSPVSNTLQVYTSAQM